MRLQLLVAPVIDRSDAPAWRTPGASSRRRGYGCAMEQFIWPMAEGSASSRKGFSGHVLRVGRRTKVGVGGRLGRDAGAGQKTPVSVRRR